jgi:YD repeat-containing protein
MKTGRLLILVIIAISLSTSCSKEPVTEVPNDTVYAIRSVFGYGKTHEKFIYNAQGKIAESQSFYFYTRFTYDPQGRIIKKETADDPDMYSSQMHEKSELMTSENSTITGYSLFDYEQDGKLKSIKNYFKKNGTFGYTSRNSFEYDGNNIVKWYLHNAGNVITQFYTYEYDKNGNVIKQKQYSCLVTTGSEPALISESSFKYDNKNNPFKIFKEQGQPGLFSNTNNVIESTSVSPFGDGIISGNYSVVKTDYIYNSTGFPVRVSTADSDYEYGYE